jgi:hypothetical protein
MNEVQSNEMTTETKVQLQVETEDFITHLVENSFSVDDIYDFIAEYGENKFINYYEEYVEIGEEYSYPAVDDFIEEFGIESISGFQDAYRGQYETKGEYAEQFVNDCYCVDIPEFLVIDWESSFDNLDCVFTENGFVFDTCF